ENDRRRAQDRQGTDIKYVSGCERTPDRAQPSSTRRIRMIARTSFLLFGTASTLLGQTTNATLRGSITDQSGAVLPGVTITAKNQSTAVERTTLSDETGNYQLAALPVGVYQIEVRLQGMKPQIVSGLTLEVGQIAIRNFKLEVGGLTEEVTVAGDAPVIETTTITVGQVINQRTVQEIPLNGRHFLDLGMLIPG